nr:acyltransferase [Tomitella biformata]
MAPVRLRGFIPSLEGMRALAAFGVLTTHVAFQTGHAGGAVLSRAFGRLDLAVAVFFALSGFLLWRGHARAARGLRPSPPAGRYYRSRVVRILPAYLVVVLAVLWLLPEAAGVSWKGWLANLTLTQVFVPLSLTGGLTHMWSLSVEIAFYLVLPLIALAMCRLTGDRARFRIPLLLAASALSLGWGFVDLPVSYGVNTDNWLPGYVSWFAAGMILAELTVGTAGRWHALAQRRLVLLLVAIAVYALSCTNLSGPPGLVQPAPWQYLLKTLFGAILGFVLLAPLILGDKAEREGDRAAHRVLAGPVGLTIGRWSYSVFLWHLAVLSMVFPAFGIAPFSGNMPLVWVLTVVLTLLVSAASYALVEEPARRALVRWESRRSQASTRGAIGTADSAAITSATNAAN